MANLIVKKGNFMSYMKELYYVIEEEKENKMNLEKRSQKTKEDWIKIIKHLKAKGFRGVRAEKEAARCLKEIEKNDLKKAHEEYTENLDKLKNLWS